MDPNLLNAADLSAFRSDVLVRVRGRNPAVHCIYNDVALNITANLVLAAGATPSFSYGNQDLLAFVQSADVLCINLGMLVDTKRRAIRNAIQHARFLEKRWVLDPAMIHRSTARARFCKSLLEYRPAIIRGNSNEIRKLSKMVRLSIEELSQKYDCVIVETGPVDRIAHGSRCLELPTGHERMHNVTGIGCALSAVLAAGIAVSDDRFAAAADIVAAYGSIGHWAAGKSQGPGSFPTYFIDGIFAASGLKSF